MAVRFLSGIRRKLKVASDDYTLYGSMNIIEGASTGEVKYITIGLDETHALEIDREDLIRMYEFMMKPRKP